MHRLEQTLLCRPADAQMAIDQKAHQGERAVGDDQHQVDAVVVGAGRADLFVFLRTGGGRDGLCSGRTGQRGARRREQGEQDGEQEQIAEPAHECVSFT